jgi:cell division septation protein DedD
MQKPLFHNLLLVLAFYCTGFLAQNSLDVNIPEKISAYSVHTLVISISKGDISSFSKYQIDVPENIIMKEGNGEGGHFSFEGRRAKYVWVECPKANTFTLSMILLAGDVKGKGNFEHVFYYIDGDAKKNISDAPMEVDFTEGTMNDTYRKALENKITKPSDVKAPVTVTAQLGTEASISQTKKLPEAPDKKSIPVTLSGTTSASGGDNNQPSYTQPNSSNTTPVSLSENREYRIQIGSFASKPQLSKYANLGKLSLIEENGSFKLMVGSYYNKDEALKKMEELKAKGHQGFIVSFINGVKVK